MIRSSAVFSGIFFRQWLLISGLAMVLLAYLLISHRWGGQLKLAYAESERELMRSIFYGLAIILFPVTNLLRFILLRLNQTMVSNKTAKQRYALTVMVCLLLTQLVPSFGFIMFMLGDDFNTLYIFSVLGGLGLFLHRPKLSELMAIEQALVAKTP